MIPLNLKLTNFLSYKEENFDFSTITIATVVGENGTGKSSFCTDGITWALFGQGSKGGVKDLDNYVKKGEDSCTVEFDFELNKNIYKIIRNRNSKKNKTSLSFFLKNQYGDLIPLSTAKITEVQMLIEDTLKMNYKTFTASSMVLQGQSNSFTEQMSDTERKEALINILNVEEWDEILKNVNVDIATYKNELLIYENNIKNIEELSTNTEKYKDEKNKLYSSLEIEKTNREKLEKELAVLNKKIIEKENIEKTIEEININLYNQQKELQNLEYEQNKNINQIKIYKDNLQKAKEILNLENKIKDSFKREQEINLELEKYQEIFNQHNLKYRELNLLKEKGINWNSDFQNRLNHLKLKIKNSEEQSSVLNRVPCSSNSSLNNNCPLLQLALNARQTLINAQNEYNNIKNENNPYRVEYAKIAKELSFIQSQMDTNKKNNLELEKQEVKKYSYLITELEVSKERVTTSQKLIITLDENNNNIKEKINNIKTNIINYNYQLEEKKKILNNYIEIQNNYNKKNYELNNAKNTEQEIIKKIVRYNTLLEQIKEGEEKILTIKNKIQETKHNLEIANLLAQGCSKKGGVPALIVENAVPELETIANKTLEKMLNGRLSLKLETQVETKTTNNIQEVLRITVLENGFARNYNTYSGAEKFIIDLSLRIAMSKFLAHRAGSNVQMFILDEGLGCTDDTNRDEIVNSILSLTNEFKKILVITHIEELKDVFDQKIIVQKDSKGSHINIC